jgi:hypothetical protein
VIGDALRSRTDETEATEVAIAARVLDQMLGFGHPNHVRAMAATDRAIPFLDLANLAATWSLLAFTHRVNDYVP